MSDGPALRVAVVTVSDRAFRGERDDRSGPALAEAAEADGAAVVRREVVPDEPEALSALLAAMCDAPDAPDVVVTTGGTGLGPRDRTPEATVAVCERLVPGIPEALRADSLRVTPHGMLSRGVAGVRGRTLVVNLPGSTGGARDGWAVVAPIATHAAAQLRGGDHPAP
ncbi:MAG TPA: MogA/MoaB family molybdenum cofactor biosynthesis protein [Miltoncostaeaceae bacterium]|nr:MogA/MoaB family molybdenum cofactor biosynthesis protein [Miltoncostaeaceae bacterium]